MELAEDIRICHKSAQANPSRREGYSQRMSIIRIGDGMNTSCEKHVSSEKDMRHAENISYTPVKTRLFE